MKVIFGDKELEAKYSFMTLVIYEQQFGSDLIQDLFGRPRLYDDDDEEDGVVVFDYTATNWTALLKSLWAMCRTADQSFPPFETWAAEVGEMDINLVEIGSAIMPAIQDRFFRPAPAAE